MSSLSEHRMKMSPGNTRWLGFIRMLLVIALVAPSPLWGFQERVGEIMRYEHELAKVGLEATERLLKTRKWEKADTEGVWDELNEKYFTAWDRLGHVEFDSLLKGKQGSDVTKALEWANAMKLFRHEMQSMGRVVKWQRQMKADAFSIEITMRDLPAKIEEWLKKAGDAETLVGKLNQEMAGGKLTSDDLNSRLDDIRAIRSKMENVSSAVLRTVKDIDEWLYLNPDLPKDIGKIIENFGNAKARHPLVDAELTDWMVACPALMKKSREDYEEVRKDFDAIYQPVKSGKALDGVMLFKGLAYNKLPDPVMKCESELKLMIAKTVQKEASDAQLKKDLEEDERLSRQERDRILEIARLTGPEPRRALELELVRAGGPDRIRDIQLRLSRMEPGSPDYEKLREEFLLLDREEHPDQLAVKKKIKEFEDLAVRLGEESREIALAHEARRKKLGLKPTFAY